MNGDILEYRGVLTSFDVETGGVDPGRHALLEVALHATGPRQWSRTILPEEGLEIEPGAAKVNGYSPEEWARRDALPEGVVMVSLIEELHRWGRPLVDVDILPLAHSAGFEIGFLKAAMARHGLLEEWQALVNRRWRCSCATLGALQDAGRVDGMSASLDTLIELTGGHRRTGPHRAQDDATACYEGYVWMINLMRGQGGAATG